MELAGTQSLLSYSIGQNGHRPAGVRSGELDSVLDRGQACHPIEGGERQWGHVL